MFVTKKLTNAQLSILVLLRVVIGWHFLYEGITKLTNPDWSSVGYLLDSKGFLSGFYEAMAGNPDILAVVDFFNIWGLIGIGIGLILGVLTNVAICGGITLLGMYYLSHPPFVGLKYALPTEGSYLVIDKVLIEFLAMWVLLLFPTNKIIGIDRLIFRNRQKSYES
jgi:thiosulfate dehydrogenase [quinone] large subunit